MKANSPLSTDPELAFIAWACDPAASRHAGEPAVSNWSRAAELAITHRVYPRVAQYALSHFPRAEAALLKDRAQENAHAALRLLARTAEVVELLRAAGIASLVLKGPLLAHDLYGDVALRAAGDVDILVSERDLGGAANQLDRAGYTHHTPIALRALARHRRTSHDISFAHPEDQTLIELHADIAQPHYGFRYDLADWWSRRRPRRIGNTKLWTLSPEDGYLMAATHAAKHRWERLDLICDLAVYRRQRLNWPEVDAQAAEAWMLKTVRTGERIATAIFGNGAHLADVECEVIEKVIAGERFGKKEGTRLDLALRERTADRARYLWRRLLSAMPKV